MGLRSINPATGQLIESYNEYFSSEIDLVLNTSMETFMHWQFSESETRIHLLKNLAHQLRLNQQALATLITLEMGKPITESLGEIEKCALTCEYYAEHAIHLLSPELIKTQASKSYAIGKAMGPLLAIMPWNFPFWQVFRFAGPAITGGNTVVLKHASNVCGCALAIQKLFSDAGYPKGAFQCLLIPNVRVEQLIADKRIKAITLTGSTPVGRIVAQQAGKHLKKIVLELGGSDPYIILEDADLIQAVEACVTGRLVNAGQSCIGAKRFIVLEGIYNRFEEFFTEKMKTTLWGDPMDKLTQMGPMARMNLRDDLHAQAMKSVDKGAKLLTGGYIPQGEGYYYPPTVLSNVSHGMPAWNEELFGPVASLIKVKTIAEAIKVANGTTFGLGAAVFTKDIEKGQFIAENLLEAGSCFVNDYVRSDPRLPFGGIKESGYGRELSHYGIKEFMNIKTVWIK